MVSHMDRFMAKVMPEPNSGCWLYDGHWDSATGYGRFGVGQKVHNAHRWLFEATHGPMPAGGFVCHRCDNKACVNPDHLYAGTAGTNMRDTHARNPRMKFRAMPKGEAHHRAKITSEIVIAIRVGKISRRMAKENHGLSPSQFKRVRRGETWQHVEGGAQRPQQHGIDSPSAQPGNGIGDSTNDY
jgi:hypothetical protein